ncbi:MAG: NAD-dependent deacetylase [Candidatus Bathyarchaeia archaeon]
MNKEIKAAAELIISADYVVALTGAGVSVESGILPFRGPDGVWTRYGEPPMDGYRRFKEDPRRWWEERLRSKGRRRFGASLREAKPNPGHRALAEMERMGLLRSLITQNIDNLHIEAGSRHVLEIHGNIRKLRCVECSFRFPREGFDLAELPPLCPRCGGVVKSDTVMFGEPIPPDVLNRCLEEAMRSDCMLVVGTSAVVHPAASLPLTVKWRGGTLIEVNPRRSELSPLCDVTIREPSGEALPELVSALKRLREPS